MSLDFIKLDAGSDDKVDEMSAMATEIVREHYDPIIGKAQNDYMIARFQSPQAITRQLADGVEYYFVESDGATIGFLAFYFTGNILYLSKFYLYKEQRGKGLSRQMLDFLVSQARGHGCTSIELNVNRGNVAVKAYESLGFHRLREEKNDIGNGFFMDDFVYGLMIK